MTPVHAVLVRIPHGTNRPRSKRVAGQRRAARVALDASARLGALPPGPWAQDEAGVPVFEEGAYWSIAHKPEFAAGIVADHPVGIDIEALSPRRAEFFDQVAAPDEWDLAGSRDWETFYRFWTAKEATLKANRVGISRMDACRIVGPLDDAEARLDYDGRIWRVSFWSDEGHLAAVATVAGAVRWHVIEADG